MSNKLSVVISVGRGPGLQPQLPGAYEGHREYAEWANSQEHDIVEFTDEHGGEFDASDVENVLIGPIDNQSLSELWIYFAGHGECSALEADYWLLRRDNATSRDIIDVGGTVRLARRAGIPRVVVISDACRSTGDAFSMALHEASSPIVPPRDFDAITPKVDRLLAAGPGTAALEVQERNQAAVSYGVFTRELMRALRGECVEVQERTTSGDRMAVAPLKLQLYLVNRVQAEAAAIAGGYPQRPDMFFESQEPLALLDTVPQFDLTLRTQSTDGSPLGGTTIQLLTYRNHEWDRMDERPGPEAVFPVPSGLVLKAEARGPVELIPEAPLPVFEIGSPMQGRFVGQAEGPLEGHQADTSDDVGLTYTRVVDTEGRKHVRAPGPGVFHVVTYDPLSNRMASGLQEFTTDSLEPLPISVPGNTSVVRAHIAKASKVHGRHSFETRVGLTITGLPESECPIVGGDPGILDGVFFEDGNWHIRGTRSGNVVVRVREHYFPLPLFQGLIGTIRLAGLDTDRPTMADLSFAPSGGTGRDFDLTTFDHGERLIGESGRDELDALQMLAVRSAKSGFFELAIDKSVRWAERLRQLKHYNPVFGVVAAYAYDRGNRPDQIVDMMEWFAGRAQSIPFDHALLSNSTPDDIERIVDKMGHACPASHVAPTWPMLTQGWTRLSDYHVDKYPVLKDAARSLVPGFWTTATGDPGETLLSQVDEGRLQWT